MLGGANPRRLQAECPIDLYCVLVAVTAAPIVSITFEGKPMHKTFIRIALVLLAAGLTFIAGPVHAENEPASIVEMWVVIPKDGHATELNAALKEHMAFRSEQGDPWKWDAYTPLLGDDLDRVAVRSCCHQWADMDTYAEWLKGNSHVNAHFGEHVAPHVEKYEHFYEKIDWANSHWNTEGGPYTFFAVTEFDVKAGHDADFRAALEKMSQIAIEQGWANDDRNWVWSSTIGGKPTVSIVVPHENMASMAGSGESFGEFLARQLGSPDAAAELMQQFSGSTWGSNYQIWVHETGLSASSED
mgnify:FL=1